MSDESLLFDERGNCWSLMSTMTVDGYLSLVRGAYENRGGLEHQREALKTTTGKRIRARMVEDIKKGALLPPVVVGVVVGEDDLNKIGKQKPEGTIKQVFEQWGDSVSIIDGMQRTTAFIDALEDTDINSHPVRVEFWISSSTKNLIYRMLVLNTGQVPWSLSRQLQVVYSPLIDEMSKQVNFESLITLNSIERRTNAGEFKADRLIEAFIAFGVRRTEVDTKEILANEFSRLDMVEAISSGKYEDYFYPIMQTLVDLDKAFSRYAPGANPEETSSSYSKGRNIFDKQTALIGYVVACATSVLGHLEMDDDKTKSVAALKNIQNGVAKLEKQLKSLSSDKLGTFLSLDMLSEIMAGQKKAAVGRHERAFFEKAFETLIKLDFEVPSMGVCWRA